MEENYISWKKCIFYSFLHIETKIFRLLSEKFRWCRQISILRLHRNILKEKIFFFPTEMKFSNHFRTLSQIVSAFHRSVFGDVVETVFNMSIGALGRKTNILTFYISLGSWARNFGPFSDKLLEGCQNCILIVHGNKLRKNNFFKNLCFFNICGPWPKTFWPFFEIFLEGMSKLYFICP